MPITRSAHFSKCEEASCTYPEFHGMVVADDGSHSWALFSKVQAYGALDLLVEQGRISAEEAEEVRDQVADSRLPFALDDDASSDESLALFRALIGMGIVDMSAHDACDPAQSHSFRFAPTGAGRNDDPEFSRIFSEICENFSAAVAPLRIETGGVTYIVGQPDPGLLIVDVDESKPPLRR